MDGWMDGSRDAIHGWMHGSHEKASQKTTMTSFMSQPYFGQVWGWSPTLGKSEDLESSGTPKCSELDSKAQKVIGKVLKRRYKKWPRIGHLNICSPSYGQKKGRESNCQFDSRPLKVGNRPLPDLRIESAIRRWKDLGEGYKFGLDLVTIRLCSRELWAPKVPGLQLGSPGKKWHSGVGAAESHRIYCGVSCGPKCPWLLPTPKGVPECELTTWVVCFDVDSSLIY
jgi:hypothetical protein